MIDQAPPVLLQFRRDLRLRDHAALTQACRAAVESGSSVLAFYVLDLSVPKRFRDALGGAGEWYLHESLTALNGSLEDRLHCFAGDPAEIIPALARRTGARALFRSRSYVPQALERDRVLEARLAAEGVMTHAFSGELLYEPDQVLKSDGTPYRVFTPFFRKGCAAAPAPGEPLPAPSFRRFLPRDAEAVPPEGLGLLPRIPWYEGMRARFPAGERGAEAALRRFVDHGLKGYGEGRDVPAAPHVSELSPRLHFGEVSPRSALHAVLTAASADPALAKDADKFHAEMGWREFSANLLIMRPDLPEAPLQSVFEAFPWREDDEGFTRWTRGMTGYPLVDAGMRELWHTGYMHNRVRMAAASFLIKHLLIDWRRGMAWFEETLCDADLANNSASWQWVAGCGADAAPYYRIFNPTLQAKKFDPEGRYLRKWLPELAGLPDAALHTPFEAPPLLLRGAGVTLGKTYPAPMVDHAKARERALQALASVKPDAVAGYDG